MDLFTKISHHCRKLTAKLLVKRFIILSAMALRTVYLKPSPHTLRHRLLPGILLPVTVATVVCAVLGACVAPLAGPGAIRLQASYVVAGEAGQSVVRAIVSGPACPALVADGVPMPMATRAAPETIAARPSQGDPALAKPASFPVRVCERKLAPSVRTATVLGHPVALLTTLPQRIVVVGDTGCRIKSTDKTFQDCANDQSWPFRRVADRAAAEGPDMVIHVGDYHYRESPCPPDMGGCAGSPWGYGWDAWNADFFVPADKLLAAAPWVVARGNHEECARAGQGWFRLLDPRPFVAERSCDREADDPEADFSEPYAIPLGDSWQLIVFDSAVAGNTPLRLETTRDANAFAHYQAGMRRVAALADKPGMRSLFVAHHPVFGFIPPSVYVPDGAGGNPALLAAMRSVNGGTYFPAGIRMALHGHVHLFEAIDATQPPVATIVAGNGGDSLDNAMPVTFPGGKSPAEGVQVRAFTHASSFGYLVMERGANSWTIRAKRVDGTLLTTCTLSETGLVCDKQGRID